MTTTTLDSTTSSTSQNADAASTASTASTATAATASTGNASPSSAPVSKRALWAGRIMSGLVVAFLGFDATFKLMQHPTAIEGTTTLGYPASSVLTIGIIQLVCLIAYLVPSTAVLGAVLWTGYLGGAVATHLRLGNPLFSHQLFPLYVAALLWGGLWLRDPRVRAIFPLRRSR